jgi:RND family efflux transporter MFP subunit
MSAVLRRLIEAAAGLAAGGGAIFWLSGGLHERVAPGVAEVPVQPAPAGARLVRVERSVDAVAEWASGTVASARETVVSAQILARIEEVRVSAGDAVAAGDAIVLLDAKEAEARAAEAREALAAARARLALAEAEMARVQPLFERGVVTRQRLDQATAELSAAKAGVDRLAQTVEAAETALSYTVIRAPVGGLVVDRLAEPGEMASPARPLLRIYDPAALRVEAPVRESLAVRLRVGQALPVEVPAAGAAFDGRIEEIVPFAEPGARTLLIKVGVPQDPRLYAGLFARIAIPAGARQRLSVPAEAVARVGQLDFVTVVDAQGRLARRLVTLGEAGADGRSEVLSGLAEGETVLLPE